MSSRWFSQKGKKKEIYHLSPIRDRNYDLTSLDEIEHSTWARPLRTPVLEMLLAAPATNYSRLCEQERKGRNRVPDRSLRRSIVGEAIKGTLIVASDEQWRHRNYRYTPVAESSRYSLSLSLCLSLFLLIFLSFALLGVRVRASYTLSSCVHS